MSTNTLLTLPTLGILCLSLSNCVKHNVPLADSPNTPPNIFVDQDGTFYPNNWKDYFTPPSNKLGLSRSAYSLKLLSQPKFDSSGTRSKQLVQAERNTKELFKNHLRSKKRIFILIHGYNNTAKEAALPYSKISNQLDLKSTDSVLHFHWDGLVSVGVGNASSWNNASGYSQLAGQMGLRKILNVIKNKDIYIISHSRGASVAISALSDPRYTRTFESATVPRYGFKSLSDAPNLLPNRNRIKLVLLAPAIGKDDFYKPTAEGSGYRKFSNQVKSIAYTSNLNDTALKKIHPSLSGLYNPTDLGYNKATGDLINMHYGILKNYPITSKNIGHSFNSYLGTQEFINILKDLGIKK